ncbi:GNAT family N-acetyltransferase [Desulfonema magnum]|uniref:GNAT domain-containing protein n=1 Tax=Desulfonema magnum TaxID=45655 RepID=A0A975BLY1_9BACT|nr:GNAT family N-acetyltransferase [Desulfonema magnum]QTA87908.1 GNAT domain-containing protein [Desulfonema magnum]
MSFSVQIAPFTERSIKKTFLWIQNPMLRRDFLMRGELPTFETHLVYFKKTLKDPSQKVFAILCNEEHVGNCGLKHIVLNKESELWIYIGEENLKNKGVASIATKQLVDHAFNELGLVRLYLHLADFNMAAVKLYKKLGFSEVPLRDSFEWANRGVKIIRMELSKNI